jgi:transcriptional regulator with XRE-family HTH domain
MIGTRIRQLRNQKNFSLRALAQATGLSHSFICDVEHGRCNPSIETLQVLARALGVKPEFFFSNVVANHDHDHAATLDATGTE